MNAKVTPMLAAAIIGKSDQFIRIGLQRGLLRAHGEPIGTAMKMGPRQKKYVYYINPRLFAEFAGLTVDELAERIKEADM